MPVCLCPSCCIFQVPDQTDGESIARLLLNVATLEFKMFRIYQQLIETRQDRIESACSIVKNNLRSSSQSLEAHSAHCAIQ